MLSAGLVFSMAEFSGYVMNRQMLLVVENDTYSQPVSWLNFETV